MQPVDDLHLPAGLTSRPLTMADAHAVYEVMARQEQHDLGKVEIEPADIVGDWQKPSFDVGASTVGVFDGDALVAYAEVNKSGRGDAAVHPSYRRRGIGTTLASWMRIAHRRARRHRDRQPGPRGVTRRPAPGEARLEGPLDQLGAHPPRGRADRGAAAARRLRDPRGHARGLPRGSRRQGGRVPRVVRARARALRGLPRHDRPAPRLRALALPGGDRRAAARSSARP